MDKERLRIANRNLLILPILPDERLVWDRKRWEGKTIAFY